MLPPTANQPIVLSRFMVVQLRFLQLFGLCPVPICSHPPLTDDHDFAGSKFNTGPAQRQWPHIAYLGVHIIGFTAWHLTTLNRVRHLVHKNNNFSKFNDFLHYIVSTTAHILTLVVLLFKRQHLYEFLRIYAKLRRSWSPLLVRREVNIYRRLLVTFLIFLGILLMINVIYVGEVKHNNQWLTFFMYFVPINFMCHISFAQFVFYMELLRCEIVQLSNRIEQLTAGVANRKPTEICKELRAIMECYHEIYTMHMLFKRWSAVSIVAYYLKAYVSLLSECYWSYWMIYHTKGLNEYIMIVPTALDVSLLLMAGRNLLHATQFLGHHLHKLHYIGGNLNVAVMVQNFSLQLMHEKIIVNPFGLFSITCHMALGILGSITTYMIFFIQFMHKF